MADLMEPQMAVKLADLMALLRADLKGLKLAVTKEHAKVAA